MLSWLKSVFAPSYGTGRPTTPKRVRVVRARYDAAQTTPDNLRHWAKADHLSANASNMAGVRRTLRNRARYEVANNSYARGIVLTLANDCIGTGPRLQMLGKDAAANSQVEAAFTQWADSVGLAEKLRTMRMAKAQDGEAFAILTNNPNLPTPVKLDLRLVEADQVTTPLFAALPPGFVDGIVFDSHGNPQEYHVLKQHPGDAFVMTPLAYDRVPAWAMVHYFRADRPGQARGIPEIMPALALFAQLRRYTLAVIAAAEAAADVALVIYTDAPPNGETDALEAMDTIELEKRMATVMPGGWKLGQAHAEQPATTYAEFKREILNEIARCLNMPFNVAAANSSGYNYASGRLDWQTYFRCIRVEQSHAEAVVLDRILSAWVNEATLVEDFLPQSLRTLTASWAHQWVWDGTEHVDPAKEATAQEIRLRVGTTTLAREAGRAGEDWEDVEDQRARELRVRLDNLQKVVGLTRDEALAVVFPKAPASGRPADAPVTESRAVA